MGWGVNEKGGGDKRMMTILKDEGGEASGGRDGNVVTELQLRKDKVSLHGV